MFSLAAAVMMVTWGLLTMAPYEICASTQQTTESDLMKSTFMAGPNRNAALGMALFNNTLFATSGSTMFTLQDNGFVAWGNECYNMPFFGAVGMVATPSTLFVYGPNIAYTTDAVQYQFTQASVSGVTALAPYNSTVFISFDSTSTGMNKRGYMVSNTGGRNFAEFNTFDFSGGVAVDSSGYFYLGIYVGNYTGTTPVWVRQQFVIDLDLVVFDKQRGYGACEGTLCVSSSATAASDFSPITSTSFPCAQRGLSPNWCTFWSIVVCNSGAIAVVVIPGDTNSKVVPGLYVASSAAGSWKLVEQYYFTLFTGGQYDDIKVYCPPLPTTSSSPSSANAVSHTLYASLMVYNYAYGTWAVDASNIYTNFTLVGLPYGTSTGYAQNYPLVVISTPQQETYLVSGGASLSTLRLSLPTAKWTTSQIAAKGEVFYSGFYSIAASKAGVVLVWDASSAALYRSTDLRTDAWDKSSVVFNVTDLAYDTHTESSFIATTRDKSPSVYRSDDNGYTWTRYPGQMPPKCYYGGTVFPLANNNFLIDCGDSMVFYDNSKQSWVFVNTTWKDQTFQRTVAFVEDLAGGRINVWAYAYDGIFTGVYTLGSTWLPFLRISEQQTGEMCVSPKGTLFIAYGDNTGPSGYARMVILRSDDRGNTFTVVGTKVFDNQSTYAGPAALACTDTTVYATAMDGGLVEFYDSQ